MDLAELNKVARAMVAPGKGILAADESGGTIKKRFTAIGVESTETSRRDYRELLFRSAKAMADRISGVILFDETIRQQAQDGTPLVKVIEQAGSIPGIKVDKGAKALAFSPGETTISAGVNPVSVMVTAWPSPPMPGWVIWPTSGAEPARTAAVVMVVAMRVLEVIWSPCRGRSSRSSGGTRRGSGSTRCPARPPSSGS